MDAIKLITTDHDNMRELFKQYEDTGERAHAKRGQIANEVFLELEAHAAIEEEIFYPAVRATRSKDLKDTVAEGIEEHHVVDVLIGELKQLEPSDEQFEAKFKVLMENVQHHMEEEEKEMLPDAKERLGKRTEELGEQMAQRKQAFLAQAGAAPSR